jgi:prepilin-type N-terminal cleavage/methylation domain-containing protein
MSRQRANLRGFTLVEVLATIAFIGILLPSVVEGVNCCMRAASESRSQSQAAALAQSKLAELTASAQLQHATLSGDFGADWPGYQWKAELSEYSQAPSLRRLDVTVTWRRGSVEHNLTLSTLVYMETTS